MNQSPPLTPNVLPQVKPTVTLKVNKVGRPIAKAGLRDPQERGAQGQPGGDWQDPEAQEGRGQGGALPRQGRQVGPRDEQPLSTGAGPVLPPHRRQPLSIGAAPRPTSPSTPLYRRPHLWFGDLEPRSTNPTPHRHPASGAPHQLTPTPGTGNSSSRSTTRPLKRTNTPGTNEPIRDRSVDLIHLQEMQSSDPESEVHLRASVFYGDNRDQSARPRRVLPCPNASGQAAGLLITASLPPTWFDAMAAQLYEKVGDAINKAIAQANATAKANATDGSKNPSPGNNPPPNVNQPATNVTSAGSREIPRRTLHPRVECGDTIRPTQRRIIGSGLAHVQPRLRLPPRLQPTHVPTLTLQLGQSTFAKSLQPLGHTVIDEHMRPQPHHSRNRNPGEPGGGPGPPQPNSARSVSSNGTETAIWATPPFYVSS